MRFGSLFSYVSFFHANVLYTCFPMLICLVRSENWTNTLLYSVSCQSGVVERQLDQLCQSGVVERQLELCQSGVSL